jgi:hypothetical protein
MSTIFAPFLRAMSITLFALGPFVDVDSFLAMLQNRSAFCRKKSPAAKQQQGAQARIVSTTHRV